jgi:hypothetical protein
MRGHSNLEKDIAFTTLFKESFLEMAAFESPWEWETANHETNQRPASQEKEQQL